MAEKGPEVTLGRVGLGAGGAGGPRRGPAVQAGLGGGRRVADTGAHGATVRDWQGPEQPHSVHRDRSVPGPFQVSNAALDAAPSPPTSSLALAQLLEVQPNPREEGQGNVPLPP